MGRVSYRKVHPKLEKRVFEIFWTYLAHLHDQKEIRTFLISLLSRTEQMMLAKRLAIAVLLEKGYNYEQIDQVLKVSKSTVGMIHRQLESGTDGYRRAIAYILSTEDKEKLWNILEEITIKLSLPKAYGSIGWKQKSERGKKLNRRKQQLEVM